MSLTFNTITAFLTLFLCVATILATQKRRRPTAEASQDSGLIICLRYSDRELDRPRLHLGDVTRKALVLPQPEYPRAAWAARVSGDVKVEVVIDINSGRVAWARVLDSPPLLQDAVRDVVCQARFSPTNDVDGRVSGILIYRFVPRR